MRWKTAVLSWALALADGAGWAAPVRFDLAWSEPPKSGVGSLKVVLRLEEAGAGLGASRVVEREVEAPGSVSVDLPAGSAWRVEARGKGVWSPPFPLSGEAIRRGSPIAVMVFPAGVVRGHFEGPARERPPALRDVDVRLTASPSPSGVQRIPPSVVQCPAAAGELRCLLPTGWLDLRIKAPGFVPIYRWGIDLEQGGVRDMGTLVLKRGSSLVGRVEAEGGAALGSACTVRLAPQRTGDLPQHASPEDVAAERRLYGLARETHPNDRGFFAFEDLAPGLYAVTASAPGLAAAQVFPVEVREGLEAEIRAPLTLGRPAAFEVVLDPPLDPYGQPWRLALASIDASPPESASAHRGVAASDGRWVEKGVAPGRYRLQVLGEEETRWVSEDVEVRAGQPPLLLSVPVVEVRGTVTRGGEPLAATLWFGGRHGPRRIRFDADAKGRFEGILPREGKWPVEVASDDDPSTRVGLAPVEVKRPPGKQFASVALRVPATLLRGKVVDEEGSALEDAQISIQQGGQTRSAATTDRDGRFTLRGLAPGALAVEAVRGERTSGWVNAAVEEDHESPRLRLVARRQAEYRGRVASPRGPVAGAQTSPSPSSRRRSRLPSPTSPRR
jgi:hypothetical protein